MSESVSLLGYGFALVFQWEVLAYAFFGCLLGTLIGVLPGLGPLTTMAILLPLTYQVTDPLSALVMLSAIYYAAAYGGSTTSILLNLPGEANSVVTCLDGHEMAKQGRAGPALAIAAIGSFLAATMSIIALTFVAPFFASFALAFGPPEYLALGTFGIVLATTLSGGTALGGLAMALLGLLLGLVGVDTVSGADRFYFGILELMSGIPLVPLLMGLFGLGEILYSLEAQGTTAPLAKRVGRIWLSRKDIRESVGPILRGTGLGFLVGAIPGGGAVLSSFVSYAVEKKISRTPEEFGRGAIAGVAGPESANNAGSTAAFVPLLTLGLPGNAVIAVLFAALLIQGIEPGPLMMRDHPDVFWGVIASMYVGNAMLLILNLPLIGLWVQVLRLPNWIMTTLVVLVAVIGAYGIRTIWFDVWVLVISGLFGYLFRKAALPLSPLVMAFILANILDTSFRQSLLMADGSLLIFVERPIAAVLFAGAGFALILQFLPIRRLLSGLAD